MTKIILETSRLVLRETDIEKDLDIYADMMNDEDTVRYIGGKTLDRAGAWRQMATLIGHQAIRGYSFGRSRKSRVENLSDVLGRGAQRVGLSQR